MVQGVIANLESGSAVRTKINANDAELYAALRGGRVVQPTGVLATDTANIQTALDASAEGKVFLAQGTFNTYPLLGKHNAMHIQGMGKWATRLNFTPTGNATTPGNNTVDPGTCLQFCKNGGSSILFDGSLKDMYITTTDTTYTKAAIRTCEVGSFDIENVMVYGFNGGDSCALQTFGHELLSVNNVTLQGRIPIRISKGLTNWGGGVYYGGDHFNFNNCYLTCSAGAPATLPHACVLVDDGAWLTTLGFTGAQAWVGGKYGLYWVASTALPSIQYGLHFHNIRKEQGSGGSDGAMFHIDHTGAGNVCRQIMFDNCHTSDGYTGFYLRNMWSATMMNCMVYNTLGGHVVDAASFYSTLTWINMHSKQTATNNLSGFSAGSPYNVVPRTSWNLPFSATWTV